MSIKLFLTDLDGTLLVRGQTVSTKNIQAVKDMIKAGVIFSIATGRMYQASIKIAKALEVDVPIITYNGALIKTVNGEIIYEDCLEPEIVAEITEFCQQQNWHLHNYSEDKLYFAEHNDLAISYEEALDIKGEAVGWQRMKTLTMNVPKLLSMTHNREETFERIEILKSKFGDKVNVTSSKTNYVEIFKPNVSKAEATKILAKRFNIPIENVMAIGDSYNDLPMLKSAGHSVAMGNAADEVKVVCEFVTGDCNEDGFAQAVYKYVLNEERKVDE